MNTVKFKLSAILLSSLTFGSLVHAETQTATLAGGCFWGMEEYFRKIPGVLATQVGYAGGKSSSANYEAVSAGKTGLAESVEIKFDSNKVSYETLLYHFFKMHDPTTRNRQGNDVGTQYRSVIYYLNDGQQLQAQQCIDALKADGLNIVTELSPAPIFYPAEDYHQNFFARNPAQGYCNFAIPPKLMKLRSKFQALLKDA